MRVWNFSKKMLSFFLLVVYAATTVFLGVVSVFGALTLNSIKLRTNTHDETAIQKFQIMSSSEPWLKDVQIIHTHFGKSCLMCLIRKNFSKTQRRSTFLEYEQ